MAKPGSPEFLVGCPEAFPGARFAREVLERIPRLLIIRLRSLGDSILTLPLLESLKLWRPELELDLLIEAPFAPVFLPHPSVSRTIVLKSNRWGPRLSAVVGIRRRRYGAVLNLHGGTTSQFFTVSSGARLRIGQENHRRPWIYNARIPSSSVLWKRQDLHTVEHQLSLMRWLDIPVAAGIRCSLHVDDVPRESARGRLNGAGISGRYCVIQPTATLATKQWSAENFARIGDHLARRYSLSVIYTAGPAEAQVLLDIGKCAAERHYYWSDLPLDHLFALIEGCRLFVGNDSGPMHAAAALGKPVVAVWGSSNYRAWHPWQTEYEMVRSDLDCIPCPGYECKVYGAPKCILSVPVSSVVDACERLLTRTEGTSRISSRDQQ